MAKKIGEFLELFQQKFPGEEITVDTLNPKALVMPAKLVPEVFEWLKSDPELSMDTFDFSTCTDHPPETLDLIYSVSSYSQKHRLGLKVHLQREAPSIASIAHLWGNVNWNEREIYDLFGVWFHGHPDPRRLMMPEDWEGHPLRKDYMHPNVVKRPD